MFLLATFMISASSLPALDRFAVILGGGTTEAEARAAAAAFSSAQKDAPVRLQLKAGHPLIVASSTVAGLNPGFVIAVAGYCSDETSADIVRRIAATHAKGVYVRHVGGALDESCPQVIAPRPKPPKNYLLSTERYLDAAHLLRVAIYGRDLSCGAGMATPSAVVVRIERGPSVVESVAFDRAVCPSKTNQRPRLHQAGASIAHIKGKTFVFVGEGSLSVDTQTDSCTIYEATPTALNTVKESEEGPCDHRMLDR